MENDKLIVGLDIGTTKICAIIGRKNEFGKLEVLGMGKAVSPTVLSRYCDQYRKDGQCDPKAVKDASNMADVDIVEVIVGIAGQHIQSKIMHGSIMRQPTEDEITIEDVQRLSADMHNIVVPPGNSIIHVMPQDYTVDYEGGIKDPVGMSGTRSGGRFPYHHRPDYRDQQYQQVRQACNLLESKQLILEPLASSLSVLSDEEKEAGVCLVDIGGGTTDIAIFYENIIRHTAVIPLGGNIITADIKEGCMLMQNQAELLKTRFGKAIAEEANPNEIVSIPGLRNRPPKKFLSEILLQLFKPEWRKSSKSCRMKSCKVATTKSWLVESSSPVVVPNCSVFRSYLNT
jgi:cell division protein FtsA